MAIDPNALPPKQQIEVHVALTFAAIAIFAALAVFFNVDWLMFKNAGAQDMARSFDAVVLAALPIQAVALKKSA